MVASTQTVFETFDKHNQIQPEQGGWEFLTWFRFDDFFPKCFSHRFHSFWRRFLTISEATVATVSVYLVACSNHRDNQSSFHFLIVEIVYTFLDAFYIFRNRRHYSTYINYSVAERGNGKQILLTRQSFAHQNCRELCERHKVSEQRLAAIA